MLLAQDGIFPITKDRNGQPLTHLPASKLNIPGTIQGEGKLCGIPSLFVRLAGCNLCCCWTNEAGLQSPCDTSYAAYAIKGAYSSSIEDIHNTILQNSDSIRHIVITGGEPLLQAYELKNLCFNLKEENKFHITIETNATLYDEELASHIDFFSLSPKLSSSHPIGAITPQRLNISHIQSFINHVRRYDKDFQLKFVYACENDITEIHQLLSELEDWKNEDILLMPLGGTPEMMRINAHKTLEYCIRNGWRYCDRLHISLFGDKVGV